MSQLGQSYVPMALSICRNKLKNAKAREKRLRKVLATDPSTLKQHLASFIDRATCATYPGRNTEADDACGVCWVCQLGNALGDI